jgi:TM2 domain-containing membrane protein YozV
MNHEIIKNSGIAAVLSFIFNGLGQLYNGQILKGLIIIFLSCVSMLILIIGSILIGFWLLGKHFFANQIAWGIFLFLIGLILICIIGIYSIMDAYRSAQKK